MMRAVMNEEIPCICNQRAGHKNSASYEVDQPKAHPDLPGDTQHAFVRLGMVESVLFPDHSMKDKAMKGVFR